MTAHILFVIDGQEREVVGDPTKQTVHHGAVRRSPGTPEAFGTFWAMLSDVSSLAGGEVGAEQPYVPTRLAVLVTEPQAGDGGIEPGSPSGPSTPRSASSA